MVTKAEGPIRTWFYIDVKDAGGKTTNWGWKWRNRPLRCADAQSSMKAGDVVTVGRLQGSEKRKLIGNATSVVMFQHRPEAVRASLGTISATARLLSVQFTPTARCHFGGLGQDAQMLLRRGCHIARNRIFVK